MRRQFSISLEEEQIEKVDKWAKILGLSRTSLVSMAVAEYIEAKELMPTVQTQLDELKKMLSDL